MARMVLGAYFEADSALHRADPRFKMLFALMFLISTFVAPSFYGLAFMACVALPLCALSKVPARTILRSIKPLFFILVFAALINLFFIHEGSIYWNWHALAISSVGVYRAVFYPLRMALILVCMSLLTLTTTHIDITDAFESVLSPLAKIGFPAHELAMMLGLALRFLPVFSDEAGKIRRAQVSRGADFTMGSALSRVRSLVALLVPLFTSALRHADNLALAMESRCYRGRAGRSRMNVMKARWQDWAGLVLFAAVFAAALMMRLLL